MKNKHTSAAIIVALMVFTFVFSAQAQDKIYRTDGTIVNAKVTEVGPDLLKYSRTEIPSGPAYTIKLRDIDSVVYANGVVDNMHLLAPRKVYTVNIPQLNTWNFNVAGFAHLSIIQAYERRTRNGKIGWRFPLYIGFSHNKIAGVGVFLPFENIDHISGELPNTISKRSCNVAVGFNPKFYLFKHRIVRLFAGPEAAIGFTIFKQFHNNSYYPYPYGYYYDDKIHALGTFSSLGIAGLSFTPRDRFNMTVHGGAGVGNLFGRNFKTETYGVWQIGFSLGTNF